MDKLPTLLPAPQDFKFTDGRFSLPAKPVIFLNCDTPQALLFSAQRIQEIYKHFLSIELEINASGAIPRSLIGLVLDLDRQQKVRPGGYHLEITPEGISATAGDEAGIFYTCCTLIQLIQYYFHFHSEPAFPTGSLPCLEISDWPDFPNRGVMLDISRDKVPTMETTFKLVDMLASWKINQLQLYTEHTFAYHNHPDVWANASPFTGDEILKLDGYCRERYIELVPNQNSFGHLDPWLKLPAYNHLAEAPDGFDFPWGHHDGPFSLCPSDPGSLELVSSLFDELLPHFTSRQVNVGCDETFDLGQGRSKDECARFGTGRVYLDFLLKIYQKVIQHGFKLQFWGDIIMAHPELVNDLPKDAIALEWGYEANHPFDEHGAKFAQAGLPFYVCPGTSAWNSLAGRTDNCLKNLSSAAVNGLKHGAVGYLNTDWGDNGHWQVLPVSYLGFVAGAAYSWAYNANLSLDLQDALCCYAFEDRSGILGTLAFELGNLYREVGIEPDNGSALFYALQLPMPELRKYLDPKTGISVFKNILTRIDQLSGKLNSIRNNQLNSQLLLSEFRLTIRLLQHACNRVLFAFGEPDFSKDDLFKDLYQIIDMYRHIWLLRNRPGGLEHSLSYFKTARQDYE